MSVHFFFGRVVSVNLVSWSREDTIVPQNILCRQQWKRRSFLALLASVCLSVAGRASAGDIILFTASTDNTGGVNPISAPNNNNLYIPPIDPSVTITPNPGLLDGNAVGPLNGYTYGPFGWINDTGGTTGFINVSYTFATGGMFRLIWEVSNTIDCTGQSALATDNVLLNNNPFFNFQPGGLGVLPTGLTGAGTYGTSGAITDLSPSGGNAAFAWIDTTGNQTPIFDTVDANSASQLFSATFTANAGDVISLDAAFITDDGGPFADYGIVDLQSVPEPSSLALLAIAATVGLTVCARRRS